VSEEYRWITGGIEGGGELPPDAVAAVTVVAGSINDVIAVANYIHQVGDVTLVDGNFQTIQVKRQNDADWLASNPILAPGEMALILDANPKMVKIGDGVTPFDELAVLFSTSSINILELLEAVDAAKAAQTAAEAAAATAITKADQASNAGASATTNALLAEKWAIEEGTSTLPNGEKSAKENARLAGLRAQESRLVKRRAFISASELMGSSAFYRITPVRASAPVVITIPAQIFFSANEEEAWAIYRMEQAGGTVQFLGQTGATGADLQSGSIKAQAKYFRRVADVGVGQRTLVGRITVPAMTAGKLYVMALVSHSALTALTNLCTMTAGLTATAIRTLANQSAVNSHSALIWEAPLTAFAAGDIDVTISSGPNLVSIGLFMWAVDGQGSAATKQNSAKAASGANISTTLTAVDKASLVLVAAVKRGNESDINFSSLSSNLGLQSSGGTAAAGDANQTDPLKNFVYGVGSGNANLTADFIATAAWNISSNPVCIAAIAIPPKTVTGAGNATLHYKGGIDTLSTLYGKAVLWFDPNGKDVVVDIG
jgi:hypothetical protein